jgi:hypothetical protein
MSLIARNIVCQINTSMHSYDNAQQHCKVDVFQLI